MENAEERKKMKKIEKEEQLKKKLEHAGIRCDIRLMPGKRGKKYREEIAEICTEQPLNYTEYRKAIENHEILLDFNQKGQMAPSMRVMEAVFLGKKLITNNKNRFLKKIKAEQKADRSVTSFSE